MKKRVISVIAALLIFVPTFLIGGLAFNIAIYILTLLGIREFMKAKESTQKYPDFIRLISYIMISLLYFECTLNSKITFEFNYVMVAGICLTLLTPVVLYHNEKVYNVEDALYLVGGIFFLGFSMSLCNVYRNMGIEITFFLLLIACITDTYAFFIGKLIGRNKLLENVSPKKTWEGMIGGSLVCVFVSTAYYMTVINPNASLPLVILLTLFLSLVGQFGDLFFSAIKRKYKIKDFSNIMPGHGGILDRIDSIIFIMLAYTFFLNIL